MNVAFIPVRGGSKSIPLKNIKIINGKPLVYWTAFAACECQYIDKVYIATDSNKIKNVIEKFKLEKVKVIGRSKESAIDTASTEFAMLEFADKYEFDNIVLIQATSPLLKSNDLDRGFKVFDEKSTDSVISVVRQKRFNWQNDENGFAHPTNYDVFKRPRRQEFDGYLVENGAFYITSKKNLLQSKNRISGNIKAVEMNENTFFEIDEPSDWNIVEGLMKKHNNNYNIPEIKMFLTDCDGCLTDGGMYYSESGEELKKFNTKDGMGLQLLKENSIITGIITSENTKIVKNRANKLKVDILKLGIKDKLQEVKKICDEYNINIKQVAYVGDDINDLELLRNVGFACTVNNAIPEIKDNVNYIAELNGGDGAIREIINKILVSRGLINGRK